MSDVDDEDDIRILDAPPPPAGAVPTRILRRDGVAAGGTRPLATETPVSITYNGIAHAVMMATPCDIEDFVVGFSLTEEIIEDAAEIEAIDVRVLDIGIVAQARIPVPRQQAMLERRRNIVGQTGCGICGIVELTQAVRGYRDITRPPPLDAATVFAAFDALPALQTLNRETGATHAAAFAVEGGRILALREDVGRHNALDKLIGHLAVAGIDPASGFVVMTSRLSFELTQKCLARGIPAITGISAPTSLAVEIAKRHGLTLCALVRGDGFQVFHDPFNRFG
ncbi:formate dehydrogenase accessory sulfurtransferase FdhD [Alsobacter sp. R-9]